MLFLFVLPKLVFADTLNVAVASNFVSTMRHLAQEYEQQTGHKLLLSSGSSGKHYAQIINGAPYDVFFSADNLRPELLEQEGFAVDEMRFTYAYGRLVLWGRGFEKTQSLEQVLSSTLVKRLAIANPRIAPYGLAAEQVLASMGLSDKLASKLVKGENVNQAYQFVATGNAQLGLLSYAQMINAGHSSYWLVPQALHEPIAQQAVILKDTDAARGLFGFMQSKQALQIIRQQGYGTIDVN